MGFEFVDAKPKYWVTSDFGNGQMVILYEGGNYNRAVEVTNFWDSKQNTWLHQDIPPMDYLSVAMRKFDALEAYVVRQADRIAQDWVPYGTCQVPEISGTYQVSLVLDV